MLLSATPAFTMSSIKPATPRHIDPKTTPPPSGEVRHGRLDGPPDVRLPGGYFIFEAPDSALLVSLLPAMIHVRGISRLSTLVRLVSEEASATNPGRDLVLARLVEVLLIEALRATRGRRTPPGLLRGLADARIADALRLDARRYGTNLDDRRTGPKSRHVPVGILRPLHSHCRAAADGISPRLADGRREGPAARQGDCPRRGRQTRWLRLRKHIQHRLQPPGRAAAKPVRAATVGMTEDRRIGLECSAAKNGQLRTYAIAQNSKQKLMSF